MIIDFLIIINFFVIARNQIIITILLLRKNSQKKFCSIFINNNMTSIVFRYENKIYIFFKVKNYQKYGFSLLTIWSDKIFFFIYLK